MRSATGTERVRLVVDGQPYQLEVLRRVQQPPSAPRLAIVAYQPNPQAQAILRVCLRTIQHFTPEPHEVWVIDNHSPPKRSAWLHRERGVNVVFNRTAPVKRQSLWQRFTRDTSAAQAAGSYANAIGLELLVRLIDPAAHTLMPMHMDTMPCKVGWLSFLQSRLNDQVAAAGVRMDTARVPAGVLHVLGYLVDFQRFQQLGLSFMHALPAYDVGDLVTVRLRDVGYQVYACRNTLWQPELVELLPPASPFRDLHVDRSFDEDDQVMFLHLGRGVRKAQGKQPQGTTPDAWVQFAETHLLKPE